MEMETMNINYDYILYWNVCRLFDTIFCWRNC